LWDRLKGDSYTLSKSDEKLLEFRGDIEMYSTYRGMLEKAG